MVSGVAFIALVAVQQPIPVGRLAESTCSLWSHLTGITQVFQGGIFLTPGRLGVVELEYAKLVVYPTEDLRIEAGTEQASVVIDMVPCVAEESNLAAFRSTEPRRGWFSARMREKTRSTRWTPMASVFGSSKSGPVQIRDMRVSSELSEIAETTMTLRNTERSE